MPSLSSAVVLFFLSKQRETFQNLLILPLGENRRQEESFCDEWQQRWCPGLLLAPPGCQRGSPPPWSPSFMRKHKLGAMLEARGQAGPHVKQHKQHCDSWSERSVELPPTHFLSISLCLIDVLGRVGREPWQDGSRGKCGGQAGGTHTASKRDPHSHVPKRGACECLGSLRLSSELVTRKVGGSLNMACTWQRQVEPFFWSWINKYGEHDPQLWLRAQLCFTAEWR